MSNPDKTTGSGSNRRLAPVVASVALLGALLIPLLASSTANAATTAKKTTTTCVNYPAGNCITTTTRHHGPPTTKHHGVVITLTIGYSNGIVTWQACLGVDASGSTVQLYLNGVLMSEPGGSGVVQANGCTTDLSFPICLATGTYTAAAADAFGTPKASLAVNRSGCANPITLGSATIANSSGPGSSSTPSSSSGGLAFTGANIALLLLAAALLIVVGYAILRLNRQRRRTT